MHTKALSLTYFALSTFVLSAYGVEVCPFMESLRPARLCVNLAGGFLVAAALKLIFEPSIVDSARPELRPRRQFLFDLLLFGSVGAILTAHHTWSYGFPVGSGFLLIVGCLTIGFFAATDNALARERAAFRAGSEQPLDPSEIFPVTRKMTMLLMAGLLSIAIVVFMTVAKDVDFIFAQENAVPHSQLKRLVLMDIAVTVGIVLLLAGRVLYSWSVNLRHLFDLELATLSSVRAGDLQQRVPVVSKDEFGLIASHTNHMIEGLREKERIKSTLGKVVSPRVAEHLLSSDTTALRAGQRRELAILICDIRDFTTLSEQSQAEDVVRLLNSYFTAVVAVIDRHGGVVDKFIGDAVLAVFGLDDSPLAASGAVRAALEIAALAGSFKTPGGKQLANGVGVHLDHVVAGAIGSPERYEFTVIGDGVNTASRLEGLSKSLGHRVVLSRRTHDALPPSLRAWFEPLGSHHVKGKQEALELFGEKSLAALPPA